MKPDGIDTASLRNGLPGRTANSGRCFYHEVRVRHNLYSGTVNETGWYLCCTL